MNNLPKLKNIQLFLRQSYSKSKLIREVRYVFDIAKFLASEEFEGIITPYIDSDCMFFIWARMNFEDGSSMDTPIAHFLGDFQVSAATYRALYDASNR